MPHDILLGIIKNCRPKGKKKQGETIKETSRSMRQEWVNKWPNYMLARWWWWHKNILSELIHIFMSHVIIDSTSYIKMLGLMRDILAVREKISKGIKSMSNKIPS
jgi:hypothetical protein